MTGLSSLQMRLLEFVYKAQFVGLKRIGRVRKYFRPPIGVPDFLIRAFVGKLNSLLIGPAPLGQPIPIALDELESSALLRRNSYHIKVFEESFALDVPGRVVTTSQSREYKRLPTRWRVIVDGAGFNEELIVSGNYVDWQTEQALETYCITEKGIDRIKAQAASESGIGGAASTEHEAGELKIPARAKKAWQQYQFAKEAIPDTNPTDRQVYMHLRKTFELEGDSSLPQRPSWERNLREYRRLTDQQKNKPRASRANKSRIVVPQCRV